MPPAPPPLRGLGRGPLGPVVWPRPGRPGDRAQPGEGRAVLVTGGGPPSADGARDSELGVHSGGVQRGGGSGDTAPAWLTPLAQSATGMAGPPPLRPPPGGGRPAAVLIPVADRPRLAPPPPVSA